MKVGVPRQREHESRISIIPAVVKKLVKLGCDVIVESGAGQYAHHLDADYQAAGATIIPPGDASEKLWADCDIVITINPPTTDQASKLKNNAILVGMLNPVGEKELLQSLCDRSITSFSMEYLPRTSRAQSMDVLSSQANLAGYKAVLLAANACPKMFPMMITAAGTIAPAKVFIIGAGVAGLQAIATAKRLGATVEAFDVRAATKEQIMSLGARFVELPTAAQDDASTGGYAKEQTDEERQKQAELMAKHVTGADIVITTAAIFGKDPPMLIDQNVVSDMKNGSVLVDLAASTEHNRGNCEITKPGESFNTDNGVTIIGYENLAGLLSSNASQVYANNMYAFCELFIKEGNINLNMEDDLIAGTMITHNGNITNQRVADATA
ncbi:NAD(P) transhydrogenase subunit alpha part 1 [Poriferisphaera corsica]|uniref:proton-translocating NAD(P)(+) transhydrogenase n=1 Tax=Poriferisphaera corsica TaxID=2528020 RepID=A0A517YTH3_9BACT|nr:Re/Si-specific NAD(P)(+) transhydrogenase subunit alpha [Poriferisphaera corsica]QDU33462.1 NAD(P) transhydrogenase subunit alpha part 1 [Poriferisphaera corsica]